jgi:hypothetical protein
MIPLNTAWCLLSCDGDETSSTDTRGLGSLQALPTVSLPPAARTIVATPRGACQL